MVKKIVSGLHHITALASDAQKTQDFYAGILGLRLIKKTVNFDAPDVYHLYYGNEKGVPGTILTFFPYTGIPKGKKGKGQLTVISFSVSLEALDYWIKRLAKFQVKHTEPELRFDDEIVIYFEDSDGLGLELVFNKRDQRPPFSSGNIPTKWGIKGFYGMTMCVDGYQKTANLLTSQMDHVLICEKGNRFRYSASSMPGDFVDVLCSPEQVLGQAGAGTVHHVAFKTESQALQEEVREKLLKIGLNVTPVLDRQYFHSIYFREPGGVLFEIATVSPGFTVDESLEHLGESLKLPPWEEKNRKMIEAQLPPINFDLKRFED